MKFQLQSAYQPTGDQPQAIDKLITGLKNNLKHQVLLGVTGSGKTFTLAKVIANVQKPTLVISHNKTLAAQLYQEFRDYFPKNSVGYFVSYYDYYQPEAYIPQTDTYIAKETQINDLIDRLRLESTAQLLSRSDVIIVASVSSIYNLGSPQEFKNQRFMLRLGDRVNLQKLYQKLVNLFYTRGDYDFTLRGSFRSKAGNLEIWPSDSDQILKIKLDQNLITQITLDDRFNSHQKQPLKSYTLYPAKHYLIEKENLQNIFKKIQQELQMRLTELKKQNKHLEAHRLKQRTQYDLEMIAEIGYVNGIENYSRYFDGRQKGDPPYTLLDYFHYAYNQDFLLIIDESHMTLPQLRGMYRGDLARKKVLIDFGFRLPSAFDNRPLHFKEFLQRVPQMICASATPDDWEINQSREAAFSKNLVNHQGVAEQLIRPTGLVDPQVSVRQTHNQIQDLIAEIKLRQAKKERVLITTLTKKMAEALTTYLHENVPEIKVTYLHADVETLKRTDILEDLRKGNWQVIIGINLLREGLDLPEVSLVVILDADKEGFLRSKTSLIQTMGRAARHINGQVILYADQMTKSMQAAIDEVSRRRQAQIRYNHEHGIQPQSIIKPIRAKLIEGENLKENKPNWLNIDPSQLPPSDRLELIKQLERDMRQSARLLDFEKAAQIRDKIEEIKLLN